MKALMYHYVRPAPRGLPHFRYLHVDHFDAQLEYIDRRFGLLKREAFEGAIANREIVDGAVLTFDDAFRDHYDHVLPRLLELGAWGIFYVPTSIYSTGKVLGVHRIHLLLGEFGGAKCLDLLMNVSDSAMFADGATEAFRTQTYRHQSNDDATLLFKRMLNFYVSSRHREGLIDALMAELVGGDESELVNDVYMSLDQVRELADAGMVVGSHTVSHPVLSKLSVEDQRSEIRSSFEFLKRVTGRPVETFCYPHGGFHTFTRATERLLAEEGAAYSFNVEPRDIENLDLVERPHALPRYDCNLFPFGAASIGSDVAATPPLP